MPSHVDAATSALIRTYQRIQNPTAKDAKIRDIGLKAIDALAAGATQAKDPYEDYSAKQVQELVLAGELSATDALAKESAGKQRKALTAWLEEQVKGEEDGG